MSAALVVLALISAQAAPSPDDASVAVPAPPAPAPLALDDASPDALPLLRVAVYDFELDGVEPRLGRLVTESVLLEVRKLRRVSVIGTDEIRQMLELEAEKQALGCADDSCLAEIADALGVDALVIGTLARVGDEHVFGMRLLDQKNAEVSAQVSRRFEADTGEEFLTAVGPAVKEIFPGRPLREGQTRGVDKEVAKKLDPPPLSPWVFWTTTSGSAIALALAASAGLATAVAYLQFFALIGRGADTLLDGRDVVSAQNTAYAALGVTVGLVGIAGLGFGAAGLVSLFTDFAGVGVEPDPEE